MFQAVIIDRDGVINADSSQFIRTPQQWQPLPGALQGLSLLAGYGLPTGVATNQSGVARGLLDLATLQAIHAHMCAQVSAAGGRLGSIRFCPHGPDAGCACRKPQPGLLHAVAADLGVATSAALFIGDSLRDMQAALRAGCTPALVRTGNGGRDEAAARAIGVRHVFADLGGACRWLVTGRCT